MRAARHYGGDGAGRVRILIVADDGLTRAGLAALLADGSELEVVGTLPPAEVEAGNSLDGTLALFAPDVILWEFGWQDHARQVEQLAAIADDAPPILAVRASESLDEALWISGVRGILARTASAEQIAAAVRAIVLGLAVFPHVEMPVHLAPRADFRSSPTSETPPVEPLTPRELEVLQAIADGMANKQIARTLGMSEHTVKFHVNSILGKLGASSRTDAVVRATRAGILLL